MRMEKIKSDRRWRQRLRRDVLTSRAPTHKPIKALDAARHFLFRNFPQAWQFNSECLVQRLATLALLTFSLGSFAIWKVISDYCNFIASSPSTCFRCLNHYVVVTRWWKQFFTSKATTPFYGIHTTQGLHRVYGQPLVGVDHVTTTSREEYLHVVSAGRYPERTEYDGLSRFGTYGGLDS